jgi:hypothetical protein
LTPAHINRAEIKPISVEALLKTGKTPVPIVTK